MKQRREPKTRGFSPPQPTKRAHQGLPKEDRRSATDPRRPGKLIPDLPVAEYNSLKELIRVQGVLVPIIVDQDGKIIDGVQRDRICKELGINCPRLVQHFASAAERLEVAITLNIPRRHWTCRQRRELVAAYLKVDAAINDCHLGDIVGVSKNTVASVRNELQRTCQIDKLEQRRGRDGKDRPAKYRQIIPNTPEEAEQAQEIIKDLPQSCAGKVLDATTATRRARRHVGKQNWEGQVVTPSADEEIRLYHCPFQELEGAAGIAAASINAIITDILYDGPFLPQVSELAEFAKRVLVPGGLLVTLSGTLYVNWERLPGRKLNVLGDEEMLQAK